MIGRRGLIAGCLCCGALASGRATAQGVMLCDFAGFGFGMMPPILGQGTPRAYEDVTRILSAIDLQVPITILQAGGGNAFAMRAPDGQAIIGYNPAFLGQLLEIGGPFAPISVLAHEVGHHANGDTTWFGVFRHPWHRELGADFVSGLALARLGASPEEATRALRAMFNFGSPSHPDTPRRMAAVMDGWQRGSGRPLPYR